MYRFSFREFWRCVKAIYAFGSGYKLGEGYLLGKLEQPYAQRADGEAWQLGYDLATKRRAP
jgi:hypothetical protein